MPHASGPEIRFHELLPPTKRQERGTQYWQRLRGAVIAALDQHYDGITPLPSEVARFLRDSLREVNEGGRPEFFSPRSIHGGRGNLRKPVQQLCIEAAIAYLTAADLKLVDDSRSRETVAHCYGVSRRTVSRWLSEAGAMDQRDYRFTKRWTDLRRRSGEKMVGKMISKVMRAKGGDFQADRSARRTG